MKTFLAVCCLLLTQACGGGPGTTNPAPDPTLQTDSLSCTGDSFYQLCSNTFVAYDRYEITGHFNPKTLAIENVVITGTTPQWSLVFTEQKCAIFGAKKFYASTFVQSLTPPENYYDTSLKEVVADAIFDSVANTPAYIGEGYNGGGTINPGEPLITLHPIAGEKFDVHSVMTHGCDDPTPWIADNVATYSTIGTIDPIDGTAGVWYTGLQEHNWGAVFNYVYAPNGEQVKQWWINNVDADGNGTGILYIKHL